MLASDAATCHRSALHGHVDCTIMLPTTWMVSYWLRAHDICTGNGASKPIHMLGRIHRRPAEGGSWAATCPLMAASMALFAGAMTRSCTEYAAEPQNPAPLDDCDAGIAISRTSVAPFEDSRVCDMALSTAMREHMSGPGSQCGDYQHVPQVGAGPECRLAEHSATDLHKLALHRRYAVPHGLLPLSRRFCIHRLHTIKSHSWHGLVLAEQPSRLREQVLSRSVAAALLGRRGNTQI